MKEILLVSHHVLDDKNCISKLKAEYRVDDTGYIVTALYRLKKPEKYSLIIIEVSMPVYKVYSLKETANNLRTGIVFYEKEVKHLNIPVIFWSRSDKFSDEISQLDGLATFVKKDQDVDHLLNAVNEFVKKHNL